MSSDCCSVSAAVIITSKAVPQAYTGHRLTVQLLLPAAISWLTSLHHPRTSQIWWIKKALIPEFHKVPNSCKKCWSYASKCVSGWGGFWRFKSSETWRYVAGLISRDVSKGRDAVIFRGKAVQHTKKQHGPSWKRWQFLSLWRNSPHFMKPEGSLPRSQEPATSPYPQTDQSRPRTHYGFLWYILFILILSPQLRLGLPSGHFSSRFASQTLSPSPTRHTPHRTHSSW